MRVFTDFKRLLRKANIAYIIDGKKSKKPGLTVSFTPDSIWMDRQINLRYTVYIKFDMESYYVTVSSLQKQFYAQGFKRNLEISVFCFTCEELVTKLDTFGYLTRTDGERIKNLTKEGYKYTRKKKVVKKVKTTPLPRKPKVDPG